MARVDLNVQPRQGVGKSYARSLRRQGLIPGVVYGSSMQPCPVTLDPRDLEKALSGDAGWNTLLTLKGQGEYHNKVVILKDVQIEPIKRHMVHADFHAVNLKETASFNVPVNLIGEAKGEQEGGSLQLVRKEIDVVCLPTAVPASIDIDVTEMEIGDVVHIEDVSLPQGVEAPHEANYTVVTMTGAETGGEEEAEEGEMEAAGAESEEEEE